MKNIITRNTAVITTQKIIYYSNVKFFKSILRLKILELKFKLLT